MSEDKSVGVHDPNGALTEQYPQLQILQSGGFDPYRVRWLIYGESGVGKTVLASTAPSPIFLNADDGLASVTRNVGSWDVVDWTDFIDAYQFLANEEHSFRTVVLDTVNELQTLSLQHILRHYPDIKRSYSSLAGISDYGKMLSDMDGMVRLFKSLPMNVIFITQVQPQEFATDTVMPQLIGKSSARNLCRMVDLVGYMYKRSSEGESIRSVAFDAVNFVTKDRTGKLPHSVDIPDPDMGWDLVAQYWA